MNRRSHSASASLLGHCPRWQRWAPSLVWLGLVRFLLPSQLGPARPYSPFTSFAYPSFPNIISVSHLLILLPAKMLARWADFPINKLQFCYCVMILCSRPWLRQSVPGPNQGTLLVWHVFLVHVYLSCTIFSVGTG